MRVRFWGCNALDGYVAGEIPMLDWSLSQDLMGGARLSGSVNLNQTTRDGRIPDYPAIRRLHGLVQPGFRSVVATGTLLDQYGNERMDSRRVLGEFIVDSTEPRSDSSALPISGVAWGAYPSYRGQDVTQKHASVDVGAWMKAMLEAVYNGASVTVPALTAGRTATNVDRPIWSGHWMDAIREATEGDPGLEWMVETIPTWNGTALASITRNVVWGNPEIRRTVELTFEAGEPMTRHGNCVIKGGGEIFSDYARMVVALGAGEGSKQLIKIASNSGLSDRGYLDATKVISFPDVASAGQLASLARRELAKSQGIKDGQLSLPRDPYTVTAWVDKLTVRPRPGDVVRLKHNQSHGYPGAAGQAAIDQTVRVGETSYRGSGSICEMVEVRAL